MTARQTLEERPLYGTIISTPTPQLVETVAAGGFDFILVDHMHSPIGWETASIIAKTARAADLVAFYRPNASPGHGDMQAYIAGQCGRALSVGFDGLFVSISDETDAEVICDVADKVWQRDLHARARLHEEVAQQRSQVRERVLVIAQFESLSALGRLEEVAAVKGLDGLAVANSDVTLEMSGNLNAEDRQVVDVIERVRASCQEHGLHLWCNTGYGFPGVAKMSERAGHLVERGANFVLYQTAEYILLNSVRELVEHRRAGA